MRLRQRPKALGAAVSRKQKLRQACLEHHGAEGELVRVAVPQPDTYTRIKHRRQSWAVTVIKVYLRCKAADSLHRFSVVFHFEAAVDSYSIR